MSGVEDTTALVSAFNDANVSHEKRTAILQLLRSYISLFDNLVAPESDRLVMEFVQLANIKADCMHAKKLLQSVFNVLCTKISDRQYGYEKLVEALSYFLLSVDCSAFEGNPSSLTNIARDIMKKLGPAQTYSRGTFPTHSISLFALHHTCSVIQEVDKDEFDHDKQDGLYREMSECLQSIISTQSYYPFRYQASLTQQSLARMDSNDGISSKERWYRLFCGVKGTAYFCQALLGAISMHFDLDSLENGIKEWSKARASNRIEQNSWYEIVQTLIDSRLLVQNDSNRLHNNEECFGTVEEIQDKIQNKQDQVALRFALIHEATLLVLDSDDEKVKGWAVAQLTYFGKCCAPDKGWAQNSDVLEALVEAALKVRQKGEFCSEMKNLLAKLNFGDRREEINRMMEHLDQRARWNEGSDEVFTSYDLFGADSLFNAIKTKLSSDASKAPKVEIENMLRNQPPLVGSEQLFFCHDPAQCPSSSDTTGELETTDFWAENMYCANLRQTLCLKVQEFTKRDGLDGYLKAKTHIDAKPRALGHCQHILLSLELLESSLSASKQQDRKKILDSANLFEDALELIKCTVCDKSNFRHNFLVWIKNAAGIASVKHDVWHLSEVSLELFVKVVKVVQYFPEEWEKIKGILDPYAFEKDPYLAVDCILSVMTVNPEITDNLQKLPQAISSGEETKSNAPARQRVSESTRLVRDSRISKCAQRLAKNKGTLTNIPSKRCTLYEALKETFAKYPLKVVGAMHERTRAIAQLVTSPQQVVEQARDSMAFVLNTTRQTLNGIFRKMRNWEGNRIHERSMERIADMSIDDLLRAYREGPNDRLIHFIVPKLFSTPVTVHGLESNGPTKLVIQRDSTSKNEYTFDICEDAKTFLSAIKKYTQQRFPKVAALIPEHDESYTY